MDEWIKHDGKGIPVSGFTFVLVKFRDGMHPRWSEKPTRANSWGVGNLSNWDHSHQAPSDIVEYSIFQENPNAHD